MSRASRATRHDPNSPERRVRVYWQDGDSLHCSRLEPLGMVYRPDGWTLEAADVDANGAFVRILFSSIEKWEPAT